MVFILFTFFISSTAIRIDTSSGIFTIQRDPDEKGPRLLPCMTYVSVGELQAEDLRLEWYRAESNSHRERISNYTSIASDLWRSKVAYPTDIRCQQIPSQTYPQYFDCSLTIPHFTEDFTDYYKCEVVYFMEGVKVSEDSRELRLESKFECYYCKCYIYGVHFYVFSILQASNQMMTSLVSCLRPTTSVWWFMSRMTPSSQVRHFIGM